MIEEYVEYRDGGLYWKRLRGNRTNLLGRRVGCAHNNGYRQFRFDGTLALEHRAIWELHNGPIPDGLDIDHINRDRSDNRIENLRLATRSQNCHNTEGKGYSWNKRRKKFVAYISNMGRTIYLGGFDNEEDARGAYLEAKGALI